MKTLHLLIILILVASSIIVSQSVFAQQTAKEILQERDDAKKTGLVYNGTMLIVTQEINKTEFKTGEKFSVTPHLENVGNNVATIIHGEPLFEIEVLDQNGNTSFIWGDTIATIGITEILEPGMSTTGRWVSGYGGFPEIVLDKPGNYTIYSMASINSEGVPAHMESIWSQPQEITILPVNYTPQINSTNSIPQNAIRTPNGGWVTPLQTTENGSKLTIHYETGIPAQGNYLPPGPEPVIHMDVESNSQIYQKGDWITISGKEDNYLMQKYGNNLTLSIDNPKTGDHWCCDNFQSPQEGTFYYEFKMPDMFQASGNYDLRVHPDNSTDEYGIGILYYDVLPSPLEQLKMGIYTLDVECRAGFVHVIKSEDKSAACVKQEDVDKLANWGWAEPGIVPSKRAFRIVTPSFSSYLQATIVGNQTFYYTTLNDSIVTYHGTAAIPIKFHDLEFTIFPGVYSGGPPGSCGVTSIGSEVTFSDGTHESLRVQIPGSPCVENYTQTDLSNHTHPQAGLEVYQGKLRLLVSTEGQSAFVRLPTLCDMPYPESNTGIPVLYMPANSTGELCVRYSNPNEPFQAGFDILEARNYSKKAEGTTVSSVPDTVPHGNSTVVYTINSGPKAGFFRMLISCPGMQLAIGYDNSSNFVRGDFPWLDQTFYCGIGHEFSISGMSGIGVKYIPYS